MVACTCSNDPEHDMMVSNFERAGLVSTVSRLLARGVGILLMGCLVLISFASPAEATTHTVKMGSDTGQLIFVPETLEIQKGDTVKWVMNKVPPHNVVFDGSRFPDDEASLASKLSHKEMLFAPGDSYKTSFEGMEAGTYPYYCEPHRGAGMAGEIVVNE